MRNASPSSRESGPRRLAETVRRGGRRTRGLVLALLLPAAGATTACDPCDGIAACRTEPRLSVGGRFIVRTTGASVEGVRVELTPVGGVGVPGGVLTAVSDAAGEFRLSTRADALGDAIVDVLVTPPAPHLPYRVRGLRFATDDRRGQGTDVGRWVVDPYVYFTGQLRNRRTGRPLGSAYVRAISVGGVPVGPSGYETWANGEGTFVAALRSADVGVALIDFLVVAPGVTPESGTWIRRVPVQVEYRDRIPTVDAVFALGLTLEYQGEVVFRGTGTTVTTGEVEFRRTGGIQTDPAAVVSPIAPNGRFTLTMNPAEDGTVHGELLVRRPGAAPVRIPDVSLATYDSNFVRLRRFSFGEQLQYVGETLHRGDRAPVGGVVAQFRRTGGIAITPSVIEGRSDAGGRFPLAAAVTDSGEVVGDLVLREPSGDSAVYRGVRLRTFASDELRLAGVWGVGEQLGYVGELWSNTTRRPAAGVAVEFRRTGGIAVTPERVASVTDGSGRFSLAPRTRERGEVVGDIVVRTDAGERTVGTARLRTFASDEVRLAGLWGYGPSLLYVVELLRTDANVPVVGAQVEVVRTGGVAVTPERVTATTDAAGRFALGMTPRADGEVLLEVRVRPPAPWPDTTITFTGVPAATFETGELRLLTALRLPPPPR